MTPQQAVQRIEALAQNERLIGRSIDARRRGDIRVLLTIESGELEPIEAGFTPREVSGATPIIVVGAGPAGLFAALELIEKGLKPIILERGKSVSDRKVDIAAISRGEAVNEDSNYCFGEGGAGTYSDGKLYTRSKKRGDNSRILKILYQFGADASILYESHPHIGSDRLPRIIEQIRLSILNCGGEVHFGSRVVDFQIEGNKIASVTTQNGERFDGAAVILATGHSASDIYELLHRKEVALQAKPFAVGVRVEHKQALINKIQYKDEAALQFLPPAAYNLAAQIGGRGVYSFCMCPGGFIVPSATAASQCVVNGMSPSGRNNIYANSGVVTEVRLEDLAQYEPHFGVLAGLEFRRQLEQMAYAQAGGGSNRAPAQGLKDFVGGKAPREPLPSSYHPGLTPSAIDKWLPKFVSGSLREGLKIFDNKMRGYITDDAQVIGVESRTSSPVRIARDRDSFEHPEIENLYPAGEGAGYAGGILSCAIDGIGCAIKIGEKI